jgi:hypothetical protein
MNGTETIPQEDGSVLERIIRDGVIVRENITRADGTILSRSYHANGSLESEATLSRDNGPIQGISRRWHPNGVLAEEFTIDQGLWDGLHRIWNDKGELLDSFEMKKGTGALHVWSWDRDSQWHLNGELTHVAGRLTGRQLTYCDGGTTAIEAYWLNDQKVSKRRYFDACNQDPRLPRYDWEPPLPRFKLPRPRRPKRPIKVSDDLPRTLLAGTGVREALNWLLESREPSRSLGEATTQEDSLKLVKKLYSLGAVAVHAVEIDGLATGDQNSGKLVVELPDDPERRKKLFRFSNRNARKLGFDPDPDGGQRYLFMMLD